MFYDNWNNNVITQANSTNMSEKSLTKFNCRDMPPTNFHKTEKKIKLKACLLFSEYKNSPLKLLNLDWESI